METARPEMPAWAEWRQDIETRMRGGEEFRQISSPRQRRAPAHFSLPGPARQRKGENKARATCDWFRPLAQGRHGLRLDPTAEPPSPFSRQIAPAVKANPRWEGDKTEEGERGRLSACPKLSATDWRFVRHLLRKRLTTAFELGGGLGVDHFGAIVARSVVQAHQGADQQIAAPVCAR